MVSRSDTGITGARPDSHRVSTSVGFLCHDVTPCSSHRIRGLKPPAIVLDRYAVGTEGPGDVGGALLRVLDELADEPDDREGDDDGGIGRELAVG